MCETSNAPASSRTARCSWITPSYWTGISQPANGTIRAPRATWRSCSGVRRSVSCTARMLLHAGSRRLCAVWPEPAASRPEERRHVEHLATGMSKPWLAGSRETGASGHGDALRAPAGGPSAAAALAEAGGDHRDAHLLAHRRVDHCAEDDVRVRVRGSSDDLGRLVDLEQADVGAGGDVQQDPGRALDRRLEQRRGDGDPRGLGRAVLAGGACRSPSAPSPPRA